MNEGMSARAVYEPPSVRAPAPGADAAFPLRRVGRIGRCCAVHSTMGRNSLTIDGDLREGSGPILMTRKIPEKITLLSHQFLFAGHDAILTGTPSGISAETTGERMAVPKGGIGEPAIKVVQPVPD